MNKLIAAAFLVAGAAATSPAQSVTAAHSGTLHYFDGDVRIDGAAVQYKPGRFEEIKENGSLTTADGRAEVLLTPGVFLRLAEHTSIRMIDTRLVSTRVELLSGRASVEADDPDLSVKDSPVTLIYKDYEIHIVKHGFIELGTQPAQLKVYEGQAIVSTANDSITVKENRLLPLSGALIAEKFNSKLGDGLTVWSRDRSQFLSTANMASARTVGSAWSGSNWYFNAYYGIFTFIPAHGTLWNPWGYGFFSPSAIRNHPPAYAQNGNAIQQNNRPGRPDLTPGGATAEQSGDQRTAFSDLRGPGGSNGAVRFDQPALGSPLRSGSAIGAPAPSPGQNQPAPQRGLSNPSSGTQTPTALPAR